jgi:hypothetical protein
LADPKTLQNIFSGAKEAAVHNHLIAIFHESPNGADMRMQLQEARNFD